MEVSTLLSTTVQFQGRDITLKEILLYGLVSYGVGSVLTKLFSGIWRRRKLKHRAQNKRSDNLKNCQILLDRLKGYKDLAAKKDYIINLPLEELIKELQDGRLKAVDAVRAYQLKALEVNKDLNCVVEPFLEAEEQALALDRPGVKKGPLHGVPVSIKDQYLVKGYDSHVGLSKLTYVPSKDDAVVIKVLRAAGAIPTVKTTVPQLLSSFQGFNPIDGVTSNAHALDRSPGGSSGGEGALIGAGGSILGFGSDIGGSIRVPCHFNGICGLKPCSSRVSKSGTQDLEGGQSAVHESLGPMAQDVESLTTAMRVLTGPHVTQLDNYWAPVPFNEEVYSSRRPLRIGYYKCDGAYNPIPPCQRAVDVGIAILKEQGHELVPYNWGEERIYKGACRLLLKAMLGDGKEFLEIMKDEDVDPALQDLVYLNKTPMWIRRLLKTILKPILNDVNGKMLDHIFGCPTTSEFWDIQVKIKQFKEECTDMWKEAKLDAVICPVSSVMACPNGTSDSLNNGISFGFAYTFFYNMLDFPAGVVPVTKVSKKDILDTESYPTPGSAESSAKKMIDGAEGLPVGLQCVTLPWQDEQCLRVMKEVEEGVKRLAQR